MGVIIFNGVSSKELGIEVEALPNYNFAKRDYDIYHVPGKSGDVIIDRGSYSNVGREYRISIGSYDGDSTVYANRIVEWLHSAKGYARLEDSYEPEYYRIASYSDSAAIENLFGVAGRVTIRFDCKPQRYLKIGEEPIVISSGDKLENWTYFNALPIITVTGSGSGSITVGSYVVNISAISTKIVIDSELQDAYNGTTNRNSDISVPYGFPKLIPGENGISFTGSGITSVEVIPRWWTL